MNSERLDHFYMDVAYSASNLSYAVRKKVGAVIVKDGNIISFGWNGTARGQDNTCEDMNGNTKPNVVHAEENAIYKLARSTGSSQNATLYLTMSPCPGCTSMIIQAGISRVVYDEEYRISGAKETLEKAGIKVERINN